MAKKAKKSTKKVSKKKSASRNVNKVVVYVNCSYNNTHIAATDIEGNVLAASSPGVIGFKGSRKNTAYAATKAAEDVFEKLKKYNVVEAVVKVKGAGMGRQAAVKGLYSAGLKIRTLMDVTPVPHGGTFPKKMTRGS